MDFWATWCRPCLDEIPRLKELYDKTERSDFEIIGIVEHSPAGKLSETIGKLGITWPQIMSGDEGRIRIGNIYGISGYPATFLLDRDGIVVAKGMRGKELEEKILNILGKNED
ncbi:MAG: TlpA family protein disulfide reductase [Bacteroidetes bacterium]|uniref:TlpA family protein disulfide reductase n=1 Tax=Candidatus Cryptobacteroides merdigallinarum TaxID=2840770 RepID=A0A9D9HF16_9BACT|nr:TlpA family protein disulfide reductase [Candidatus Cryptobacteroides merdigallinarum]